MAWLNATPKTQGDRQVKEDKRSRIKRYTDSGIDPELPPVICGEYLIEILFEIGPALHAGLGPAPLTHGELCAWQRNSGVELQPWESRTVRRLSIEYVAEAHRATEHDARSPWKEAPYAEVSARATAKSLRSSIRDMAKK